MKKVDSTSPKVNMAKTGSSVKQKKTEKEKSSKKKLTKTIKQNSKEKSNTKTKKSKSTKFDTRPNSTKIFREIWAIYSHCNIPTIARSKNGTTLKINPAAETLTGYTLNDVPDVKTWIEKLYEPALQKNIKSIINNAFNGKIANDYEEVSMTTKFGERKELIATFNNIYRNGKFTGIQIVQFLDITAKKKAKEEIAQQKYFIEQLLNYSSDKIYFKDLESRFLAVSKSFCDLLNISNEKEIIGKTDFDIFDPEHAREAFKDEQQIISSGQTILNKIEKETRQDKQITWVITSKMPYRDTNGFIIGTFGISRDITEMINARNLLKDSEERYRKLVDSSPFAILVHQNGKVVFCNKAYVKIVKANSIDELIGISIFDSILPEYLPSTIERMNAIYDGTIPIDSYELKIRRIDQEIITIEVTSTQIHFDGVKSVLVFAIDISEKKIAQNKLYETERRFEMMFNNHSAVMLLIDSETGNIKNANKAATEFYGYSLEKFASLRIFDINELPENEVRNFMKESVEHEKHYLQFNHKLASGKIKAVEVYACPIIFSEKKFLFSIIHDITERKHAEKLLRENDLLLKKAQEIANVGHYVLDVLTGSWKSSDQMDRILGLNKTDDHSLTTWIATLHPSCREELTNYFTIHVLQNKNVFDKEYRIIRSNDGVERWIHGLGELRIDEGGNVFEMFGTIQDITERKNAHSALLLTQFSIDKAKDMILWINYEGQIVYANEETSKVTGYSKAELTNMKIFDLDPTYPQTEWEANWIKNRDRDTYVLESIHRTKDGRLIPVEISVTIMNFEGNEIHCAYCRDITQRRFAQEELEESERRYKTILEYSPYSLIVTQNNLVTYVNKAGLDLFNAQSTSQLIDKPFYDFVSEDYKEFFDMRKEQLYSKKSSPLEYKVVTLDKKELEVESVIVPFSYHGISSLLIITRFIGEIKEKNEQVRKLTRAVNQSSAGIIIANKLGVIEYVNPKFCENTGFSSYEAIGQTTRLLKSGVHSTEFYKDLWDTVLSGNEWRGEIQNRKKTGELYWEFNSISAIKNDMGEITHFLAIKEDITSRKKIEEDILLAKEEAEEASKVKSSLLSNMSHEFRTPLNGILGFTQLMKDFVNDNDIIQMVEKIEKSGKRLMNTLNAVLYLTELETEDFIVQESEIDLALLCNTLKAKFESSASDRNLQLTVDIKTPKLFTLSDESLLLKIVSSICDNAIKYTNKGSITIRLDGPIQKGDAEFAVINIIDTGIGIKKENHELIFKEFRQLSEGIRRDFEGLGLGLTLASRMARLIDTEITVESELDKGSCFSVYIPLRNKKELTPKYDNITSGITNISNDDRLSSYKILLVEDNPLNIEVVQRFLSKAGKVKAVRDGKSALRITAEEKFDILLIDINLGAGIDGTEVLAQLRLREEYKDTPAVALTGYASDSNKREFLAKGFTGYLSKPFEKKTLIRLLNKLISDEKMNY